MKHSIRSDTPDNQHKPRQSIGRLAEPPRGDAAQAPKEKAVLVAVLLPNSTVDFRDPLGELAALAESAGVEIVDSIIQKRTALSPKSALGKGKLADLAELIEAHEADTVIVDNDLTPRQIRGLEKATNCKVIDRSELILDIFASRAKTHEAQIQVELAQLEYTAPRLRGMWTHLERIAGVGGGTAAGAVGGVGTRGPGERQIEIDRRIVKDRISYLKRQIKEIDRRKTREVESRSDQYTVSLVGYTNSGKTTLLNKLTDAGRYVADKLFATLDTKTVKWDLGDGRSVLLSDTVGFVRDIPHHLVASFRATLEETIHADLLLHVVDASSPISWQQMESVEGVLAELGCSDIPCMTLLNKMDIVDDGSMAELLAKHREDVFEISAINGAGLQKLIAEVNQRMLGEYVDVTISLPQSAGKLQAELDRLTEVLDRRYEDDHVEMDLRINVAQIRQLSGRHPEMKILKWFSDDEQTHSTGDVE